MLWPIISGKGIGGKQTRHASIINRLYSSSTEVHEPKGRRRTFSLRLQCFSSSSHQPQKSIFSKENFLLYKRQLTCDWLLLFSFLKIILRNFCPSLLDKFDYCCHNETFFKQCAFMNFFCSMWFSKALFWQNLALGNTRNWTLPDFGDMPCTVVFLVSNLA